ncbi:MAG TPA: hypothetical protein ACFYD2_03730 [Candidatus Avalokitesvara rifleensis]|uniref:hypothetical protein n=1 Tax=Candidatus Avalokitesvara rifleensis TaxID=3367620 RepID=UPI002713D91B|nr:hypothetical protein [Candidatus Brocadiales bacterium]
MPISEYILSPLSTIIYDILKKRVPSWLSKGIVLDFAEKPGEPFDLGLGKGTGGHSDCLPNNISMNLGLVAWNDSLSNNFLQEITAEVHGLEDAGWTSGSGMALEYDSTNCLKLRDLKPGERLVIRLEVSIGFARDAYKFVEQLGKLKDKQQGIKIVYTVREGTKTKTKELEKSGIDFYKSYYPIHESYLKECYSSEKAQKLLSILRAKGR